MLSACMIDGFGWFPEAAYRRTLLLFHDLVYVFPTMRPGLMVPPHLYRREDIAVEQPASTSMQLAARIDAARTAAELPEFLRLADSVPDSDVDAARRIAMADVDLAEARGVHIESPPWLLAYLAEKLLDTCEQRTCVPIVGQEYAAKMLTILAARRMVNLRTSALLTPTQVTGIHTIAAGLSYGFVDDAALEQATIQELLDFKRRNVGLLEAHHQQLVKSATDFGELASDSATFAERVLALRREAQANRILLDQQAAEAMRSAGLSFIEKAMPVVAGGLASAIAIMSVFTPLEVARAVAPALGTGLAVSAGSALLNLRGKAPYRPTFASYLLNARSFLASVDGYRPRAV